VAVPNPWNRSRAAFLYLANSKVQLWRMLKGWTRGLPSWALWREGEVVSRGLLGADRLEVAVQSPASAATGYSSGSTRTSTSSFSPPPPTKMVPEVGVASR
jgi:hypothetical protein